MNSIENISNKTITMSLYEYETLKKDALNWKVAQYEENAEKIAESIENKISNKYGKQYYNAKEHLRSNIRELKHHFEEESCFGLLCSNKVLKELDKLLYDL